MRVSTAPEGSAAKSIRAELRLPPNARPGNNLAGPFGGSRRLLARAAGHFFGEHFETSDQAIALRGGEPVERALERSGAPLHPILDGSPAALRDFEDRAAPVNGIRPTLE